MNPRFLPVSEYFLIGKSLKSHGTSGQLRLMIEDRFKTYLKKNAYLFFDLDGSKVPFGIEEVEDGAHLVITLSDVTDKDSSDALGGKDIFIPVESVESWHLRSPRNILEKWAGYHIVDANTDSMYTILRTEEFPQQLMAVVEAGGQEYLIPLHEQLITHLDKKNKVITMAVPDGLLNL